MSCNKCLKTVNEEEYTSCHHCKTNGCAFCVKMVCCDCCVFMCTSSVAVM